MLAFADSHVHLADPAFENDVDDVIARARANGARALVCIGESPSAALRAQTLAARFPGLIWFTCGVNPHDAISWDTERDSLAIRTAVLNGSVAIGECGLDYHYDNSPRELQISVLNEQMELAAELARPIVLHTREAEHDTIKFLRSATELGVKGVLHCFTGSHELAEAGLLADWHVSFSGVVTFRKFTDEALLRLVPAHRIMVESDAPYLAPVPNRGRRNESAWVAFTLERIARARDCSVEWLAEQTLTNTKQLFNLRTPGDSETTLGVS